MLEKIKKYGIIGGSILGVLLLLAVSAYCYDLYKAKKANQEQNAELEKKIALLEKQKADAENFIVLFKSSVNDRNKIKIVYKTQPGDTSPPPAFTLLASDTTGRWHFSYPPVVLSAGTLIDDAVKPFKAGWDDCIALQKKEAEKKNPKPKFVDTTQRIGLFVGYAVPSAYTVKAIYQPIRLGGKAFAFGPAIIAGGNMSPSNGKITGEVSAGVIVNMSFGK